MEKREIFGACSQMRRETADWLDTLGPAELDTPSLCAEWDVRGVAGHLIAPFTVPMRDLLWRTVRSGFNPHRANVSLGREVGARPGLVLADELRRHAETELSVPFVGAHGPFTDLIVHNADMRVPLGEEWQPAPPWSVESLHFLARGAVGFTSRRRLAGLRLGATDAEFVHGEGQQLSGPALALVLALCGRRVGLDALHGPGVDVLASRI